MASADEDGKELKKKTRHVKLIQELMGQIPKDDYTFEKMLVGLKNKLDNMELKRCEEGGIRIVTETLEQKGLFDVGNYGYLKEVLKGIDKKALDLIYNCEKELKKIDGTQPEDDEQDRFIDLQGESSETRALKMVDEREACDDTVFHDLKSTEPTNGNVHRVVPKTGVSARNASSISNINGNISPLHPMSNQTPGTSYLDILPGRYSTNKEQKNFLRLSMAVVDLCSDVLRTVLHSVCQPSHLIKRIKFVDPLTSKLTNDLSYYQIKIIKEAAETKSYQYFDITLLYVLLRIIALQDVRTVLETEIHPDMLYQLTMDCEALVTDVSTKLNATELKYVEYVGKSESYLHLNPTLLHKLYTHLCKNDSVQLLPTRWGGVPYKNSIKLGDDIERIHQIRNKVYGHATSTNISDSHFKIYWNDLGSIMERIDKRFSSYFKVNLDMITFEMGVHVHKGQLDHPNLLHEVHPNDEYLEEIKSNLRQAKKTITILLKFIEEQMDNITADHKHQLELKDRERERQLEMINKRIEELERVKKEQMERHNITAYQADHKHQLELKERQMELEMMNKRIELERIKYEQMERNNITAYQADYKHQLELKDRERQMELGMMDKRIELERVKKDRLSNSSRCNETIMFLMGFSVGIVSIFTTASVLLSVNQFS